VKKETVENSDKYDLYCTVDGWVCERYPKFYAREEAAMTIEVEETEYSKTFITKNHFAWRLVNNILVEEQYEEIPEQEQSQELRVSRESECFAIINRGQLWYNSLTPEQLSQLDIWYKAWLDVTVTKEIPQMPIWLKK
jgi:hypothetical protein